MPKKVAQRQARRVAKGRTKKASPRRAGARARRSRRPSGPWVASVPIVVSDRRAAKVWYSDRLGLKVTASEDHWLTVGRSGTEGNLHLCQASENQPAPIPLEPGPSGIVIAIPGDFEAECARLQVAGITFSVPPTKAPWGWYATIRDPDGNEHYLSPGE